MGRAREMIGSLQAYDECLSMSPAIYLVLSAALVFLSYFVFRVRIRQEYRGDGKLSAVSSLLECLVFCLHANFSYAFLPARWPTLPSPPENEIHRAIGLSIFAFGIVITLWTIIDLGLRKALGQQTGNLHLSGFYRYSRNPQIVLYGLALTGVAILWPSVYGLGWVLIYGAIAHMMVKTEEEHMGRIFSSEYEHYCNEVPRYFPWPRV